MFSDNSRRTLIGGLPASLGKARRVTSDARRQRGLRPPDVGGPGARLIIPELAHRLACGCGSSARQPVSTRSGPRHYWRQFGVAIDEVALRFGNSGRKGKDSAVGDTPRRKGCLQPRLKGNNDMADQTDIGDGIALLVADVDGTLLTPDKALTRKAKTAVRRLSAAGIAFTLVSSRPPRGLADLVSALALKIPFAAFNGGALCHPDLRLIEAHRLPETIARPMLDLFARRGVDAWVFADGDWRLRYPEGPFVADHRRTMGFDPVTVADFTDVVARIDKIVGVSDNPSRLAALEAEARSLFSGRVTINLSQTSYLDVTDVQANKGRAVQALCTILGLAPRRVAVIGDMMNDVAMFRVAGLAVAMGQAPETVKAAADVVTTSNRNQGFADAVGQIVLPRRPALPTAS